MNYRFWSLIIIIALALGGVFYWRQLRGTGPIIKPPAGNIAQTISAGGTPLTLPAGFSLEVFAEKVPGARVIARDGGGNFWVSQTSEGTITKIEIDSATNKVASQKVILSSLRKPHGLAINPNNPLELFFAEEHQVSRVSIHALSSLEPQKIADLPTDGGHSTRTLGFGPDKRLYVAIGSSCNVCDEKDERRAKIFSLNVDGSNFTEFARGLRNTVFFTWHPTTQQMWGTDMGRDLLGDELPPDEVNIITAGNNYGWPICYGQNVIDRNFHPDDHQHIRAECTEPFEQPSHIDLPAHSAPLGLAFIPSSWPAEYRGDLLVAYHGSWNRSEPTGYKIVRLKLNAEGKYESSEDFITGWLTNNDQALGRPVDLRLEIDGTLYISDDKAGVLYKVRPPA